MSANDEPRETSYTHWGQWVVGRSRMVGFHRQIDLAKEVGCSVQHLRRWFDSERPPKMRKGFDRSLAAALKTSHEMLFISYIHFGPHETVILGEEHPGKELTEIGYLRRKAIAVAEGLPLGDLRDWTNDGERRLTAAPQSAA